MLLSKNIRYNNNHWAQRKSKQTWHKHRLFFIRAAYCVDHFFKKANIKPSGALSTQSLHGSCYFYGIDNTGYFITVRVSDHLCPSGSNDIDYNFITDTGYFTHNSINLLKQ